jgi:hypothetical protein
MGRTAVKEKLKVDNITLNTSFILCPDWPATGMPTDCFFDANTI